MAEETGDLESDDLISNDEMNPDFEFDEEIQRGLDSLMQIPLEFMDSDEEEGNEETQENVYRQQEQVDNAKAFRGDSVERQLEALFVEDKEDEDPGEDGNKETLAEKDTGLENISDNDLDGPESGECDTSDGELPESPSVVVSRPKKLVKVPEVIDVSPESDNDVVIVEEPKNRTQDCEAPQLSAPQKSVITSKPERKIHVEKTGGPDHKGKEKKEKNTNKIKDKSSGSKIKDKRDRNKKTSGSDINDGEDKRKLKLKKCLARLDQYRAKCLEYMNGISKACESMTEDEKLKVLEEAYKIHGMKGKRSKLKSIVTKTNVEVRDDSPQSSTSSKIERASHSSQSLMFEKTSRSSLKDEPLEQSSISSVKEHKSKYDRKSRNKTKELKKRKLDYEDYIHYLQSERVKCYEEALDKHKNRGKQKQKHGSVSQEKSLVIEKKENRPPVLHFSEFCSSRELTSPSNVIEPEQKTQQKHIGTQVNNHPEEREERTVSVDSVATTSSVPNDTIHHEDDDKELFITYSDLVEQDKQKLEVSRDNLGDMLEKDPELKSISVFTSVLFKGSTDTGGIPFLQENRVPSPIPESISSKSTQRNTPTGPDELYDWNDDLSSISQSSLSPSRSPAPKLHNKALLNFLENQKERLEKRKVKRKRSSNKTRSQSKSPKKERARPKKKKTKHNSPVSTSPSPPRPKLRSPEVYNKRHSPEVCSKRSSPEVHRKRPSPPAFLKERWKDYASLPERRREHYERPTRSRRRSRSRTRSRTSHRSRSSSEEKHYHRRYRSRSRSRSRSPPPSSTAMVQLNAAEKRRRLKEEHERAMDSLRATIRKPIKNTPLAIKFICDGDDFHTVRDNYDPVLMNEVPPPSNYYMGPASHTWYNPSISTSSYPKPYHFYYPPYHHYY